MEDIVEAILKNKVTFTGVEYSFYNKGRISRERHKNKKKNPKFIPYETFLEYEKLHNRFKKNILKTKSKVYNTQLSTLPPFKLKHHIGENKFDITFSRKWREINSVIISNDFIQEQYLNKINQYYVIPTIILRLKFSTYLESNASWWSKIDEEYVLIKHDNLEEAIAYDYTFASLKNEYPSIKGNIIYPNNGNSKSFSQYDFFMDLPQQIKKWKLEVVYDEIIGEEINKGVVIDIDMFSTLLLMINSKDIENINIVKEIMSNVEYKASEPYLSYLFNIHPRLKVVGGNINYENVVKKLKAFNVNSNTTDEIIKNLIKIAPQYSDVYIQCLKVYLNNIIGKEIIKEIIT